MTFFLTPSSPKMFPKRKFHGDFISRKYCFFRGCTAFLKVFISQRQQFSCEGDKENASWEPELHIPKEITHPGREL